MVVGFAGDLGVVFYSKAQRGWGRDCDGVGDRDKDLAGKC